MSTESNRALGDYREDHEFPTVGGPVECASCNRTMSARLARTGETCAFCRGEDDE